MGIELSNRTLNELPAAIARPAYDRSKVTTGIAHLSVGNFHRAHQAVYVDKVLALADQAGWGICGIGIQDTPAERAKAKGMMEQDGLYTLTLFPPTGEPSSGVIGSIKEYLFGPADVDAAVSYLAQPNIRIVTMTVTEGGYNLDEKTGRFRLDEPNTAHDLQNPGQPRTVFGYIVEGLARRRAQGLAPFTVLSCDNLQHNGHVAKQAVLAFARARDPELADWIEQHVTFPSCMVDRITPATTPADAERLNALTGVDDKVPVFAEDFIQWVVEDDFCNGRPAWEQVGVQFTDDVTAYEQIKLRMLNSTHGMLGFPGLNAGYRLVYETMADPQIVELLRGYLNEDVIPLLTAPADVSLEGYRDLVLDRFANPNIADQLLRVTSDGANKIPTFQGANLRDALAQGREHRRLAFLLASFVQYVEGKDDQGGSFAPIEPYVTEADLVLMRDPDPKKALGISAFKSLGLDQAPAFADQFARFRQEIAEKGTIATIEALNAG